MSDTRKEKKRHLNIPAAHLVLLDGSKTLLMRRFNTPYAAGLYTLVSGHVEANESFTDCIIRETAEEAGIIIKPEEIKVAHVMHRNSELKEKYERLDVFYVASKWHGQVTNKEPDKCDKMDWFDLEDIPPNTIPYIKHALELISKDIYYSEFGWQQS